MKENKSYSDQFQDDNAKSIEQAFFSELDAIRSPLADNSRTFDSGSKRDADDHKPLVNHFTAYARLRFGYLLRKGANHYGKNNWQKGQPDETAVESLNRHLAYYEDGDRSEDHLSAIIFNAQLIMMNERKLGIKADHYYEK
jgi:hypothetical protein